MLIKLETYLVVAPSVGVAIMRARRRACAGARLAVASRSEGEHFLFAGMLSDAFALAALEYFRLRPRQGKRAERTLPRLEAKRAECTARGPPAGPREW